MNQIISMMDVESVGLHGEGYAVALHTFRIVDTHLPSHNVVGVCIDEWIAFCDPETAHGTKEDLEWVMKNANPVNWHKGRKFLDIRVWHCKHPLDVRFMFWSKLDALKRDHNAIVASDCPWPVEARFLSQCIDDNPRASENDNGPYPMLDVASVLFARGKNPLGSGERLPNELPIHHPLADARQSARILVETLRGVS